MCGRHSTDNLPFGPCRKDFDGCLQNLSKLESSFGCSTKLMLNKAVAEFYKNEFRNYEKFRKNLNELIGDIRSDSDEIIEIKDIAILVPLFNKAILLFQLRQPMAALKIILVLIHHLDLVDLLVARRIGLLAVNILLNLNQPKGASDVIELLKSRLNGCPDFSSDEDDELLLEKTLHAKPPKVLSEFKWMFRFYKFRSRIFNERNTLIPIEDVSGLILGAENEILKTACHFQSPEMLVLKAHQYYAGHDYQMAAKELTKKFSAPTPNVL